MFTAMTNDTSSVNMTTTENADVNKIDPSLIMSLKKGELFLIYYVPWFVTSIGFIGNTFSFILMCQKENRKLPSNMYIASLAVSDNLLLCARFATLMIN